MEAKGGFTDTCKMFSVAIINLICGLLGALIFCLAIWMRLEDGVRDWVRELQLFQYWNGLYILMAAGVIIVIISFIGCAGAITDNVSLMTINGSLTCMTFVMLLFGSTLLLANVIRPSFDYIYLQEQFNVILGIKDARRDNFMIWLSYISGACVIIALILELTGGILILVNGTNNEGLHDYLTNTMDRLVVDSNYNPKSNYYLQTVQEKVGCCGSRSYMDYGKNRLPISDSCREAISGNIQQIGCVEKFSILIEMRAGWIAGIALFVAALQLLLVIFTFCYIKAVRNHGGISKFRKSYDEVPQFAR